jgi:hypothetical protein
MEFEDAGMAEADRAVALMLLLNKILFYELLSVEHGRNVAR